MDKSIIDRIIGVREDHDETQRDFAKRVGINHSQWAKYELGLNEIPTRYIIKFCKYYKVSADYILGLEKGLEWPR